MTRAKPVEIPRAELKAKEKAITINLKILEIP
jgi:hypothetical protein